MLLRTRCAALAAVIAFAVVAGCAKKKPQTPASQTPAAQAPAAKQDIFDEFYQEEPGSAKKKAQTATTETFSTKSSASAGKASSVASAASSYEFTDGGRYVVQVGCVTSAAGADRRTQQLKDQGYPAYVSEVENPKPELSGRYFRIRIGGFTGVTAAKSFGEQAFGEGNYWVDNRSNDHVGMEGYGLGSSQSAGGDYSSPSTPTSSSVSPGWSATPAATPSPSTETSVWGATPAETPTTGAATTTGATTTPAETTTPGAAPVSSPSASQPAPEPTPQAAPVPEAATPASAPAEAPAASTPAAGTPSTSRDTAAGGGATDDGWGSSGDAGW